MKKLLLALLTIPLCLGAIPVKNYSFHTRDNSFSPVYLAMGDHQPAFIGDAALSWYNPALAAWATSSRAQVYGRWQDGNLNHDIYNVNSLVRKTTFNGVSMVADKYGLAWLPLAREKSDSDLFGFRQHSDYYLDALQLTTAEKEGNWSYGINAKYLWGRMVWLDTGAEPYNFIDRRGQGYTTDVGVSWHNKTGFTMGGVVYDALSGMYWGDEKKKELTRSWSVGTSWQNTNQAVTLGFYQDWRLKDEGITSLGYQRRLLDDRGKFTGAYWRTGMASASWNSQEDIDYSVGLSFCWMSMTVDAAFCAPGFERDRMKVYLSLGASGIGGGD